MLSRVADSLYWMSRYLERAEHTARLVGVNLNMMLDQGPASGASHQQLLLQSLNFSLEDEEEMTDAYKVARRLTFDLKNSNSIVSCISTARENARQIREQISTEMYEQLNRLYLKVRAPGVEEEWNEHPQEFFAEVKEGAHLFRGLTNETLAHGEAYYFLRAGKNLERAGATVNLLRAHADSLLDSGGGTVAHYLEWVGLLKSCTAFEAYCREYTADLQPRRIVEFLLLDEEMPRSVRFCAGRIEDALEGVVGLTGRRKDSLLMRSAGKMRATLDYASVDEIMATDLEGYLGSIRQQCGQIHTAMFGTFIRYSVETVSVA